MNYLELYSTYEQGTMLRLYTESGKIVIEMLDAQTLEAKGRAIIDDISACVDIENGAPALRCVMEDG